MHTHRSTNGHARTLKHLSALQFKDKKFCFGLFGFFLENIKETFKNWMEMKDVKLWENVFGCQESRMYITVDRWGFFVSFFLFPPVKHFYYNTGDLNLLVL